MFIQNIYSFANCGRKFQELEGISFQSDRIENI